MSSFAEGRHIITTGRYRITDTTDTIITRCTEGLPYITIDTGDRSRRPATITVEHRMGKSAGTTTEDMGPYPAEGTDHRRIAVEEGATRIERSAFVDNKCIISKNKEIAEKMVILRWLNRLIKPNSGLSSKSFFLVSITIIGCLLLTVPAVILLVEVWYNHTITTDLSGMAEYIGAVAAIFATAGVTKAWSEKFEVRNEVPIEMQEKQKTEGETATNE